MKGLGRDGHLQLQCVNRSNLRNVGLALNQIFSILALALAFYWSEGTEIEIFKNILLCHRRGLSVQS